MSLVPIREAVKKAEAVQALMREERETQPARFWEVGDAELLRFFKTAWPTQVGQQQ